MTRILLIDNFDSFTLNIAQYLYEITGTRPIVVPNTTAYECLPLAEIDAVIISPGPGRPSRAADFGVCGEVVAHAGLPLLGVCLGHQGIAEFFGARTVLAPAPAHGIVDTVKHSGTGLFDGLPQDLPVVRYHSLVSVDLPDVLEVVARTGDDLVMAFAHRTLPVWGVQFHPESVETRGGHRLLANFVRLAMEHRTGTTPASDRAAAATPSAAALAFHRVGGAAALRLEIRSFEHPEPPADLFGRRYAHQPHAFWLDSEQSEQPGSRYSLMGAWGGPGSVALRYDLTSRRMTLTGDEHVEELTGDVFALCQEILSGVQVDVPSDWPLAFTGGLVGYFGYELKALTMGDERHRSEEPDAYFLHTRDFVVYDHCAGTALDCRLVDLGSPLAGQGPDPVPPAPARASPVAPPAAARFVPGPVEEARLNLRNDREEYLTLVDRAQDLIIQGETYEVCLTNRADVHTVDDGLATYLRMRSVSPVPCGAYLRCGDIDVLSSSPETFLRVDRNRIMESRPIKGTRPRGRTPREDQELQCDLFASVKDRAENLMIVDLVRHDFNAVCEPGSVHVPSAFALESYSSVHQLVSTVRGRLRWGTSALEAVRACFPGGSMTGAPKKRTMQIIDDLEGAPRGVYSGSIGWLSFSGALDLSIVIRTVLVAGRTASFGVGGAITARSDRAEEFTETLVKASVPWYGLRGWQEPVQ